MFDDGLHTYLIEPLQQTHPVVSYSHVIAAGGWAGGWEEHQQRSMLTRLQIELSVPQKKKKEAYMEKGAVRAAGWTRCIKADDRPSCLQGL